jgi:hypothetical protein
LLTVLLLIYFSVVPAKTNVDFVFFPMLELTAETASAIWWPDFPHISPEAFPHFLPFSTRIRIIKEDHFLSLEKALNLPRPLSQTADPKVKTSPS